jgi:hypothetical protein
MTRLPYGVAAELCCLCVDEWEARLSELPDNREAEIERQAREVSRAFERHQQQRAGCSD